MGRRLFSTAALCSWLILFLLIALWVRSFWVSDRFHASKFSGDGQFVHWDQRRLKIGRGAVGYSREVETFPRSSNFRESECAGHTTWPAEDPEPQFGSPRSVGGFRFIDRV